jgi:hypothetical protein
MDGNSPKYRNVSFRAKQDKPIFPLLPDYVCTISGEKQPLAHPLETANTRMKYRVSLWKSTCILRQSLAIKVPSW